MKVWVYVDDYDQLKLHDRKQHDDAGKPTAFIGTLDLDIKPEKKWVTKKIISPSICCDDISGRHVYERIPYGTKNVTITYEVEE